MPRLLSGSTLRRGGSGEFLDLKGAQPQLPPTPTTSTGYTVTTDNLLRTTYSSSLGNLEFNAGTVYNNIPNRNIVLLGTGTGVVVVSGGTASTGTSTGALVVQGGVGVSGSIWTDEDIHVNGLTIGQGYEGINNIVIKGTASPQIDSFFNGQESIVIGTDALFGLMTSYKNIAIGRYALSSGTEISDSIAIGDSALKNIGTKNIIPVANITAISTSSGTVSVATGTVIVTAANHNLTSGTSITITGVVGTTELNDYNYYVDVLTSSTLALYSDIILTVPVDGTGYTPYNYGGLISYNAEWDSNIAIGNNAGTNLINGRQNLLVGVQLAQNLNTGSYNIFIGHEVANNMIRGSANISIGGDNLVDGLDNQVNIGSVFYFDGSGYSYISSDVTLGIGTESTGTSTGAVTVLGGMGVTGDIYSNSGNPEEGNLLYTPIVTVNTGTVPISPRIGDIWIDSSVPAYLQYIKDGTSTFWIQVGAV
jgi:hypothetical protein